MRNLLFSFLLTQLVASVSAAENCQMVNVKEVKFGVNKAIEGTCSNNGEPIRCTLNSDDSVKCNGPAGTYTGYDKDTMIYSSCGCGD
jgi:hypothetical protein